MKYSEILPNYLNGSNIRKHASIIEKQDILLHQKIKTLQLWNQLQRPILVRKSSTDKSNVTLTFFINMDSLIKSIRITVNNDDVILNEVYAEDDSLTSFTYDYTYIPDNTMTDDYNLSSLVGAKARVEVVTHDDDTYIKEYPENDTRQGNNNDHDEFLDLIGNIIGLPRRIYNSYQFLASRADDLQCIPSISFGKTVESVVNLLNTNDWTNMGVGSNGTLETNSADCSLFTKELIPENCEIRVTFKVSPNTRWECGIGLSDTDKDISIMRDMSNMELIRRVSQGEEKQLVDSVYWATSDDYMTFIFTVENGNISVAMEGNNITHDNIATLGSGGRRFFVRKWGGGVLKLKDFSLIYPDGTVKAYNTPIYNVQSCTEDDYYYYTRLSYFCKNNDYSRLPWTMLYLLYGFEQVELRYEQDTEDYILLVSDEYYNNIDKLEIADVETFVNKYLPITRFINTYHSTKTFINITMIDETPENNEYKIQLVDEAGNALSGEKIYIIGKLFVIAGQTDTPVELTTNADGEATIKNYFETGINEGLQTLKAEFKGRRQYMSSANSISTFIAIKTSIVLVFNGLLVRKHSLEAYLYDEYGNKLSNQYIRLNSGSYNCVLKTDSDGKIKVSNIFNAAGTYTVDASFSYVSPYAPTFKSHNYTVERDNITMTIEESYYNLFEDYYRLKLVNSDDEALIGYDVSMIDNNMYYHTKTTDETGVVEFKNNLNYTNIPNHNIRFVVDEDKYYNRKELTENITLDKATPSFVDTSNYDDVTVEENFNITGRVVDENGVALDNIRVYVSSIIDDISTSVGSVLTDDDGVFTLQQTAPSTLNTQLKYKLRVMENNQLNSAETTVTYITRSLEEAIIDVENNIRVIDENIDINIPCTFKTSGGLRIEEGNVYIRVYNKQGVRVGTSSGTLTTGSNGEYTFTVSGLTDGSYTAEIELYGREYNGETTINITVAPFDLSFNYVKGGYDGRWNVGIYDLTNKTVNANSLSNNVMVAGFVEGEKLYGNGSLIRSYNNGQQLRMDSSSIIEFEIRSDTITIYRENRNGDSVDETIALNKSYDWENCYFGVYCTNGTLSIYNIDCSDILEGVYNDVTHWKTSGTINETSTGNFVMPTAPVVLDTNITGVKSSTKTL